MMTFLSKVWGFFRPARSVDSITSVLAKMADELYTYQCDKDAEADNLQAQADAASEEADRAAKVYMALNNILK